MEVGTVEIAGCVVPRVFVEVCHVHDERIALPVSDRIAGPQLYSRIEVWTAVQRNLPSPTV